jgi:hypothetical protein
MKDLASERINDRTSRTLCPKFPLNHGEVTSEVRTFLSPVAEHRSILTPFKA